MGTCSPCSGLLGPDLDRNHNRTNLEHRKFHKTESITHDSHDSNNTNNSNEENDEYDGPLPAIESFGTFIINNPSPAPILSASTPTPPPINFELCPKITVFIEPDIQKMLHHPIFLEIRYNLKQRIESIDGIEKVVFNGNETFLVYGKHSKILEIVRPKLNIIAWRLPVIKWFAIFNNLPELLKKLNFYNQIKENTIDIDINGIWTIFDKQQFVNSFNIHLWRELPVIDENAINALFTVSQKIRKPNSETNDITINLRSNANIIQNISKLTQMKVFLDEIVIIGEEFEIKKFTRFIRMQEIVHPSVQGFLNPRGGSDSGYGTKYGGRNFGRIAGAGKYHVHKPSDLYQITRASSGSVVGTIRLINCVIGNIPSIYTQSQVVEEISKYATIVDAKLLDDDPYEENDAFADFEYFDGKNANVIEESISAVVAGKKGDMKRSNTQPTSPKDGLRNTLAYKTQFAMISFDNNEKMEIFCELVESEDGIEFDGHMISFQGASNTVTHKKRKQRRIHAGTMLI